MPPSFVLMRLISNRRFGGSNSVFSVSELCVLCGEKLDVGARNGCGPLGRKRDKKRPRTRGSGPTETRTFRGYADTRTRLRRQTVKATTARPASAAAAEGSGISPPPTNSIPDDSTNVKV